MRSSGGVAYSYRITDRSCSGVPCHLDCYTLTARWLPAGVWVGDLNIYWRFYICKELWISCNALCVCIHVYGRCFHTVYERRKFQRFFKGHWQSGICLPLRLSKWDREGVPVARHRIRHPSPSHVICHNCHGGQPINLWCAMRQYGTPLVT